MKERERESLPNAPKIDARPVLGHPDEQLRWSVPSRDDHVRVLPPAIGTRPATSGRGRAEGSRKTKVGDLEDAFVVDEQIRRLHVSVED
jgi:hypothetical protein